MRRKLLVVVVAGVLVALSATTAAALNKPSVARCTISGLHVSAAGVVTPSGACKAGKTKVAPAWSYSYRLFDSAGYACGSAPATGKIVSKPARFRIDEEGADHAQLTVGLKAQRGKSRPATKHMRVPLGGDQAVCGTLNDATATVQQQCPWSDPWPGMVRLLFQHCGEAGKLARWATPMTYSDGTVAWGHPVTVGGSCQFTTEAFANLPKPPVLVWNGVSYQGKNLKCDDGLSVMVQAIYVAVVNDAGERCYDVPLGRVWGVQIPSDWGFKQLFVGTSLAVFDTKRKYQTHQETIGLTGTWNAGQQGPTDPCTVLRGRSPSGG